MQEYYYAGDFAGMPLFFAFRHPDSAAYFNNWLVAVDPTTEDQFLKKNNQTVRVSRSDCECWIRDYGMMDDGNTEFGMSAYRASDVLLQGNCCVIHSAAMLWREKAWLFAAESGTGKSTQLKLWTELYPDEVQIINGDKPILRLEEDKSITVCPSPWKGKEEWGDDTLSAPLGGIIILKQGSKNQIEKLRPVQYTARLLSFFFSTFETKEVLKKLCRFEEAVINAVPIWRLTNLGDKESVRLTQETLFEWQEQVRTEDS